MKLTNLIKNKIMADLIKHKFYDEYKAIIEEYYNFAFKVYHNALEKDIPLMNTIPSDWLPTKGYISVQFGNDYTNLYFNGNTLIHLNLNFFNVGPSYSSGVKLFNSDPDLEFKKKVMSVKLPYSKHGNAVKVYQNLDPITMEYEALQRRKEKFIDDVKDAFSKMKSIFSNVSTDKALLDVWPECKPFAIKYLGDKVEQIKLPMVEITTVNKIFDLPIEEKAA